ncbi:hypothetical protein D9M68_848950 [compost metagenome]
MQFLKGSRGSWGEIAGGDDGPRRLHITTIVQEERHLPSPHSQVHYLATHTLKVNPGISAFYRLFEPGLEVIPI